MVRLFLALLSGILFALALPPYNLSVLTWVALVPLFVASDGIIFSFKAVLAFASGITAGLVLTGFQGSPALIQATCLPFEILSLMLFCVLCVAQFTRSRNVSPILSSVLIACTGVATELATLGFPIPVNIALTQYNHPVVIQIASITGIWGVSWLLWASNAAIAQCVLAKRFDMPLMATAPCIGASVLIFGFTQVSAFHAHAYKSVRVAAIQDTNMRYIRNMVHLTGAESRYHPSKDTMTDDAASMGAQLAVWSELCLGWDFNPKSPFDRTLQLAKTLSLPLVVGYYDRESSLPYNTAGLIANTGRLLGAHHKNRLYMGENGTIEPGIDANVFPTRFGPLGLEICFESCDTSLTRRLALHHAVIVAVPNGDPIVPGGVFHLLHAASLPFRAVENNVAMIRADSYGASEIVQPDGEIVKEAPVFRPTVVIGNVIPGDGRMTFFTMTGDWLAYFCAVVSVCAILVLFARKIDTAEIDAVPTTRADSESP